VPPPTFDAFIRTQFQALRPIQGSATVTVRKLPGLGGKLCLAGSRAHRRDLICWAKLICFAHVPSLARCEIAAFRYQVLHVAAQLTHSARRTWLRIDRTWRWAAQIADGFRRLRAAFTRPQRRRPVRRRRRACRKPVSSHARATPRLQEHHADQLSMSKGFQRRPSRP
jgi:hypothetical protein